jgi:hypothetical protein
MPSLKLSTLAVLLALVALASIALASPPRPNPPKFSCWCSGGQISTTATCGPTCDAFCTSFNHDGRVFKALDCKNHPALSVNPEALEVTLAQTSPVTETEAFMVQKAMFAIPCDLCEVTVADVQKIPEASCVSAIDNACKVVQKKFPEVKCSNLLETLACGVVRTLLESQTPAQICTQVAKCQA